MTTRQSRRTTAKRSDYYTDTSSSASSEDDRSHTDASMMDIAGTAEDRMPAPDMPPAKPKRNRSRSAGQPAAQRKTRKTGRRPEQKISSSSSSSASDYDDEEEEEIGSASQNVDADPGVDQREKEKEKDPTEHIGERPSVAPMAVEDGVGRVSRRRRPRPNNNAEAGASNDGSADPDKEFRLNTAQVFATWPHSDGVSKEKALEQVTEILGKEPKEYIVAEEEHAAEIKYQKKLAQGGYNCESDSDDVSDDDFATYWEQENFKDKPDRDSDTSDDEFERRHNPSNGSDTGPLKLPPSLATYRPPSKGYDGMPHAESDDEDNAPLSADTLWKEFAQQCRVGSISGKDGVPVNPLRVLPEQYHTPDLVERYGAVDDTPSAQGGGGGDAMDADGKRVADGPPATIEQMRSSDRMFKPQFEFLAKLTQEQFKNAIAELTNAYYIQSVADVFIEGFVEIDHQYEKHKQQKREAKAKAKEDGTYVKKPDAQKRKIAKRWGKH